MAMPPELQKAPKVLNFSARGRFVSKKQIYLSLRPELALVGIQTGGAPQRRKKTKA